MSTCCGSPTELTIETGISMPVVAAMRDYAYGYNLLGPADADGPLPLRRARAGISRVRSRRSARRPSAAICRAPPFTSATFSTPRSRACSSRCVAATSGCAGTGRVSTSTCRTISSLPIRAGPPLLYLLGLADVIMPPQTEAACNIGLLEDGRGPHRRSASTPRRAHDITARDVGFAEAWSEAKLDGPPLLRTFRRRGCPTCHAVVK